MQTSPFGAFAERAQPRLLAGLTVLLISLSAWLSSIGRELVTVEAPYGIVSYVFAGGLERSAAILASWSASAKAAAMLSLGLDYLYLLVAPAWLSLAAARLGALLGAGWHAAGVRVSWIVLGSAPFDAAENHALIQQLMYGPTEIHAQLAWWWAVPKFALVAVAATFLVLASGAWLVGRLRGARAC